jgi:hypothetical protein
MSRLPHAQGAGQAPARALDVTNPRSVFVWITEARDALDDLATVAADAIRRPTRRKLSRKAALVRYRRGRAALDWLLSLPLAAPSAPVEAPAPSGVAPPFESWAE